MSSSGVSCWFISLLIIWIHLDYWIYCANMITSLINFCCYFLGIENIGNFTCNYFFATNSKSFNCAIIMMKFVFKSEEFCLMAQQMIFFTWSRSKKKGRLVYVEIRYTWLYIKQVISRDQEKNTFLWSCNIIISLLNVDMPLTDEKNKIWNLILTHWRWKILILIHLAH